MEPEPWLRGTHAEIEPLRRAVLHALELAGGDAENWCADLSDAEVLSRPFGLPSIAFQLRHTVRSLDRLLTYAEGEGLSDAQIERLGSEMDAAGSAAETLQEFRNGLQRASERILGCEPERFGEARFVGRKRLPTSLAGLLIHCAEHTQRHAGQIVTTAKVLLAMRDASRGS